MCLYFGKNFLVIIQIFRSQKLPKSMKFDKFGKNDEVYNFSLNFFSKLPDC